jgi:hypothetical protein
MDTEENVEMPFMFYIIKTILYIIGFVMIVITFLSIVNYLLYIIYYIKELIITNENIYDVHSVRLKDINNYRLINYIKMFNEKRDDNIIKFNNEGDNCFDIKNLKLEKPSEKKDGAPVNVLEYDFNKLLKKNIEFSTKLEKIIKEKEDGGETLQDYISSFIISSDNASKIAEFWPKQIELDKDDFNKLSDQDQKILYRFGTPP